MDCPNTLRVYFATYLLIREAEHWWTNTKRYFQSRGTEITWAIFKDAFLEKFFPQSIRNRKEIEFLELKQGNMTVGEYVAKFEELSRYSNYIQNQPNEEWLTTKFEFGLKPELKSMIINRCRDIEASMKAAEDAREKDRALNRRRSDDNNKGRFSLVQNSGNNFASNGGKKNAGRMNSQIQGCPKCKKNHAGECLKGRGVCFKCGKPGHMLRNCPQNQGQNSLNQPITRVRVFTLDGQKEDQASNLVQDVILGMNWLSANCVVIDCHNKSIIFTKESDLPSESLFLSTSQLKKSLLGRAQGYVLFNLSEAKVKPNATNIAIVSEYSEVFPDEITGLPPNKEIEFSTDIIPRVGPISIAPYRMSPVELVQLKKQL
ncbi:uncharacterized protein LOC133286788 [Gastrolobium bilobum]|uniref:uncharacterized protein LOC133286788 n=1 Tax=Gastrolobium bilobum TaxID=150636 RepID=UPI002AAFC125|nr:uncharacterized protein LOC133286788 [Gastrolobium bilobum]